MGSMSIWHWIVVIAVVLLLFGRGKISDLMGDVAQGIKAFKKGMSEDEAKKDPTDPKTIAEKPADPLKQHAQTERKFESSHLIETASGRPWRLRKGRRPSGSRPFSLRKSCSTSAGASWSSSAWWR